MTTSVFPRIALLLSLCLAPMAPMTAAAQDAPKPAAKKEKATPEQIKQAELLMEAKDARTTMITALTRAVKGQQLRKPEMGEEFYSEMLSEMTKPENVNALIRSSAEVMANHFTLVELQELTTFYTTPLGRRLALEEAAVSQETLAAGAKWGAEIGKRIDAKLRK